MAALLALLLAGPADAARELVSEDATAVPSTREEETVLEIHEEEEGEGEGWIEATFNGESFDARSNVEASIPFGDLRMHAVTTGPNEWPREWLYLNIAFPEPEYTGSCQATKEALEPTCHAAIHKHEKGKKTRSFSSIPSGTKEAIGKITVTQNNGKWIEGAFDLMLYDTENVALGMMIGTFRVRHPDSD